MINNAPKSTWWGTHEMNNGNDALRLIGRSGLDQKSFPAEHQLKLGLRIHLIEFNGLGRALELDGVGFAFFLEPKRVERTNGSGERKINAHLSNIFLTCIFLFFSSNLIDAVEDPAAAGIDVSGALGVMLVRARFVWGCWASSSSSSMIRVRIASNIWENKNLAILTPEQTRSWEGLPLEWQEEMTTSRVHLERVNVINEAT
jgi:hypothetical protein